jgi:hypothetical protein
MEPIKTKLVYVLTSEIEKNYIEQALLSIYSARYHNPKAHISLITDDITNTFFVGKRAEILNYISEKIVVQLPKKMSALKRSRQLKTSFRNLLKGDLLFIDCDTIITCSLHEIDNYPFELGAVFEAHLKIAEYSARLFDFVQKDALLLGWDASQEEVYYNSGVIYSKDTESNKTFFEKWNQEWKNGLEKGVAIDQPSFSKANIECGHPVKRLDDIWNCLMFTQPAFAIRGKIIHCCSFNNVSYLFSKRVLTKVKNEGLNDYLIQLVLNPNNTYFPFDSILYHYQTKDYFRLIKRLRNGFVLYAKNIDPNFYDLDTTSKKRILRFLLQNKMFLISAFFIIIYKILTINLNKKFRYVPNRSAAINI